MIVVGKPKGKRLLEEPRHKLVDNIKKDLGVTGWGGMDWIVLGKARDKWRALVKAVMNLRVT
jgi:hypothetical protein